MLNEAAVVFIDFFFLTIWRFCCSNPWYLIVVYQSFNIVRIMYVFIFIYLVTQRHNEKLFESPLYTWFFIYVILGSSTTLSILTVSYVKWVFTFLFSPRSRFL